MTGRVLQRKSEGASALDSRLNQNRIPGKHPVQVTGTGIAFTAPGTITDSGNGLAVFRPGIAIRIQGSTINDSCYVCRTVAAGTITIETVNGIGVKTQIAGPSITLAQNDASIP